MKLLRSLDEFTADLRGGAVSIGNFDGVHRGHARIVERLRRQARESRGPAVVFTFDPHPVRLLRPEACPPPLTWTDRKAQLLAELGVDAMLAYPTDEALLSLTAEEFFGRIVRDALDARAMVEGPNFYFGRDRTGNVGLLREMCERAGMPLEIVEPLQMGGQYVSSSRVRAAIAEGRVKEAAAMLTQPYRIRGMVTHGAGRGARLGFPTANIDAIDTLLPAPGVYAGRAIVGEVAQPAAINIGPNPTFDEKVLKVEAHLLDFHGPLYGEPIEVDFLARLRDIQKFASVEQLRAQLDRDVAKTREIAGSQGA
ncbi:MAG: bifunctional riboflavin kinase/FAD synthetase [Planctomycetes bacterium]|nr:bifunctional riboflavin kinase/FAD synthetase [Planctomycetota bacterium]